MFSTWAVEVLKSLTVHLQPKLRLAHPLRFITDLLFAITVFFWFNRRPVTNYNSSFFSQLVYLVQLIKAVYTLRFLLVELVFRELRTFFCFISPVVTKLSFVRKWQTADPCVLKVVNLTFIFVFLIINFMLAFMIEWAGRYIWTCIKNSNYPSGKRAVFPFSSYSMTFRARRRPKKSARYRIRGQTKATSASKCKARSASFLKTLQWGSSACTCSSWSSSTFCSKARERRSVKEDLPKGYLVYDKKTRSGKV